eukprot:6206076-Pleurochrysis_carterae.AAC.1
MRMHARYQLRSVAGWRGSTSRSRMRSYTRNRTDASGPSPTSLARCVYVWGWLISFGSVTAGAAQVASDQLELLEEDLEKVMLNATRDLARADRQDRSSSCMIMHGPVFSGGASYCDLRCFGVLVRGHVESCRSECPCGRAQFFSFLVRATCSPTRPLPVSQ